VLSDVTNPVFPLFLLSFFREKSDFRFGQNGVHSQKKVVFFGSFGSDVVLFRDVTFLERSLSLPVSSFFTAKFFILCVWGEGNCVTGCFELGFSPFGVVIDGFWLPTFLGSSRRWWLRCAVFLARNLDLLQTLWPFSLILEWIAVSPILT
jgi:hypothetical protein